MHNIIVIALFSVLLAGCGQSAPSCTDEKTKNGVNHIFQNELRKDTMHAPFIDLNNSHVEISDISTLSSDKTSSSCVAQMKFILSPTSDGQKMIDGRYGIPMGFVIYDAQQSLAPERSVNYVARTTDDGHLHVSLPSGFGAP